MAYVHRRGSIFFLPVLQRWHRQNMNRNENMCLAFARSPRAGGAVGRIVC